MNHGWVRPRVWPWVTKAVVLVAAYFIVARVGLRYAAIGESISPVWPPTGLALAALLADVEAQHPGLLARITEFGTPQHGGGPHWRDPVTAGELKLAVKRILRLE